jgi:PAS domain S-box-containing protein
VAETPTGYSERRTGAGRRFFELSPDLLWVAGFDGYLKRVNPAWERLLGWTVEELTSRPYLEFVHPDDHERTQAEVARLSEPRTETRDFEVRFTTRDGECRWLLVSAQGSPEEEVVYAAGRDITERKRADTHIAALQAVQTVLLQSPPVEAAMPRLLAAIGETLEWDAGGFWVPDPDRDLLRCEAFWSSRPHELTEFAQATRALELHRAEDLPGRVYADGRAAWVTDVTREADFLRGAAAAKSDLRSAICLPVRSEAGQVLAVLDFFSRRTGPPDEALLQMMSTISVQVGQYLRRKLAEGALAHSAVELRRRAQELERSNAELEQFAYVASHDLTEPLRNVSGFLQLLADRYRGRLGADADEFIGFALEGVSRMQALIDDLLAYSRVGLSGAAHQAVDMEEVTEAALAALAASVAEREAAIEVGDLPVVRGDRRELSQLMQNLLSNAIKFVDEGPPRVRVDARREDGMWRITVTDNGIGIDPGHAERIFKMFQRLHGRDDYPGTGIGLAICKKIVERGGGRMWVEAGDGGGSVFAFTAPAVDPESA